MNRKPSFLLQISRLTITCVKITPIAALLLFLSGCSLLIIDSNPRGAEILYTGNDTRAMRWEIWCPSDNEHPSTTPKWHLTFKRGTFFFRTHLEDYYEPEPQLVEVLPLRISKVTFDMEEKPDSFARRQREKGLVFYEGEWVNPVDAGLVQYNGKWITEEQRFEIQQREKGLVKYGGKWMTPEEKEALLAEEYRAQGLVKYKGKWLKIEVYEDEKAIDDKVEQLRMTGETQELDVPIVVGIIRSEKAKIRLFNGVGNAAMFYLSGPESLKFLIDGYDSEVTMMAPGDYIIAVEETRTTETLRERYVPPHIVQSNLKDGFQYSLTYEGEPVSIPVKSEDVDEYIDEKFQIPTIEIPISEQEIEELRKPRLPERTPSGEPGQRRPPRQNPTPTD